MRRATWATEVPRARLCRHGRGGDRLKQQRRRQRLGGKRRGSKGSSGSSRGLASFLPYANVELRCRHEEDRRSHPFPSLWYLRLRIRVRLRCSLRRCRFMVREIPTRTSVKHQKHSKLSSFPPACVASAVDSVDSHHDHDGHEDEDEPLTPL